MIATIQRVKVVSRRKPDSLSQPDIIFASSFIILIVIKPSFKTILRLFSFGTSPGRFLFLHCSYKQNLFSQKSLSKSIEINRCLFQKLPVRWLQVFVFVFVFERGRITAGNKFVYFFYFLTLVLPRGVTVTPLPIFSR